MVQKLPTDIFVKKEKNETGFIFVYNDFWHFISTKMSPQFNLVPLGKVSVHAIEENSNGWTRINKYDLLTFLKLLNQQTQSHEK